MDPSMNNWPTDANSQQGPTPSLSTPPIYLQLTQLYVTLQTFYPDWCRQNPFWSVVGGLSDLQLSDLYVTWTQSIEYCQAQLPVAVPMRDAIEQQRITDYSSQAFNGDPETQRLFESFAGDCLNGGAQAICPPGVENGDQAAIPRQLDAGSGHQMMDHDEIPLPALQTSLPAVLVENTGDNGNPSLPAWLSLVRPQPKGQVVTVRRECQVALDINLKSLSVHLGQSSPTWSSLVIPSTASVKSEAYRGEQDVLHLSVRVFGADTETEYKTVCVTCNKREGKKRGKPSLIDFHAARDVIKAPEDGLVQVKFKFSCYPKHQSPNEGAYLLEVVLLEKQRQSQTVPSHRVVATCRLPWHFKVGKRQVGQGIPTVSARGTVPPQNGPSGTSGQQGDTATPRPNGRAGPGLPIQDIQSSPASSTLSEGEPPVVPLPSPNPTPVRRPDTNVVPEPLQRKRRRNEAGLDDGDPQAITAERHVRPRLDPGNNAIPGPSANHSRSGPSTTAAETGATQRPTPHDIPPLNGSSTSPPTSATPSTALPDTPRMEPGPFTPQLPGQNSHSQPIESNVAILRVTNPRTGPVSGNMEIWLLGEHLPTAFTLYARFGTNVTATTVQNATVLSCVLPSASHAGRVKVTLSRSHLPGGAEYGSSLAEFTYRDDHAAIIPILLRMEEQGHPEYTPTLQAVLRMLEGDHRVRDPGNPQHNPQQDHIQSSLINALISLRETPDFDKIISTTNDSNQTLAHLSTLYGYISLLRHLLEWRIDLAVADVRGLTALHCAYLKEDRESIQILLKAGASSSIEDKLGRCPRDLVPEGPGLAELEREIAMVSGQESPPIEHPMDQQIALGEQYAALEAEDERENDSGHGGSDTGSDASDNDDEGEGGMDVDSTTIDAGPSTSKGSTLDVMNQLLISRRVRKKRGPRLIPDTPNDAAISSISKKLQESEAEREAIEYLRHGVFPSGTITLEALMEPISAHVATRFQVEEGSPKYRGLLSREREMFNCRLCPEDNKLDFKDPEEALHHMTKDHFDMGYSCSCGCEQTYWTSRDLKRHQKAIDFART